MYCISYRSDFFADYVLVLLKVLLQISLSPNKTHHKVEVEKGRTYNKSTSHLVSVSVCVISSIKSV